MILFRPTIHFPSLQLPLRAKITMISITVGITLLGFLASYIGRRRKNKRKVLERHTPAHRKEKHISIWRGTNGGLPYNRSSITPESQRHRHGSISSDVQSVISNMTTATLTAETGVPTTSLTPQQLGVMGMEALETAIGYWEDALEAYKPSSDQNVLCLTDPEEGKFTHLLQKIMDHAHNLQDQCNQLFLYESSVLFRSDSITSAYHEKASELDWRTMTSISSADSFVSAQGEVADISDFEEYGDMKYDIQDFILYQEAMKEFEENGIPYRILRTEQLKCVTDYEFIAKVYCIRMAFKILLEKDDAKSWFIDTGAQLLTDIILFAEKDPRDCLAAYEEILDYTQKGENWSIMDEELKGRGVKCLTFYDVVLDFILLDAFEDLESPPSSVLAVVQNRWLSNGFKETALATAVWSVLKAKRRLLKYPNGFINRFYAISEHMSPVLAWGFLGPDENLKKICMSFKDEVLGFLCDIFDFNVVRYTKVEDLSSDILEVAQQHYERLSERFSL